MKLLIALFTLLALTILAAADEPDPAPDFTPRIVATPAAVHPQALLKSLNPAAQTVCFDWLDSADRPVDSGNSIAPYTAEDPAAPTDEELIAAITAVAPSTP